MFSSLFPSTSSIHWELSTPSIFSGHFAILLHPLQGGLSPHQSTRITKEQPAALDVPFWNTLFQGSRAPTSWVFAHLSTCYFPASFTFFSCLSPTYFCFEGFLLSGSLSPLTLPLSLRILTHPHQVLPIILSVKPFWGSVNLRSWCEIAHQHLWTFIAVLFITVKNWKQVRCPSGGEQLNKLQFIHTTEPRSVKRAKLLI